MALLVTIIDLPLYTLIILCQDLKTFVRYFIVLAMETIGYLLVHWSQFTKNFIKMGNKY